MHDSLRRAGDGRSTFRTHGFRRPQIIPAHPATPGFTVRRSQCQRMAVGMAAITSRVQNGKRRRTRSRKRLWCPEITASAAAEKTTTPNTEADVAMMSINIACPFNRTLSGAWLFLMLWSRFVAGLILDDATPDRPTTSKHLQNQSTPTSRSKERLRRRLRAERRREADASALRAVRSGR